MIADRNLVFDAITRIAGTWKMLSRLGFSVSSPKSSSVSMIKPDGSKGMPLYAQANL
jgi:hypothetical protein